MTGKHVTKKEPGADLVVRKLDLAVAALGAAQTAQETKKVVDTISALQTYARRQKLSEECKRRGRAIWVEAMVQLDCYLADEPKATGTRGQLHGGTAPGAPVLLAPGNDVPTLAERGISHQDAALARKIGALPEETREAIKAGEISMAAAVNCDRLVRTSECDTGGPTITWLHASDEPGEPACTLTTGADFRYARLEGVIRLIEQLESEFAATEPIRAALANARRVIAQHLESAPAK